MENEVLEVLREIRDEAKTTNSRLQSLEGHVDSGLSSLGERIDQTNSRLDQTNSRLDQTNSRLETVESRLRFVDKRLTSGFAELTEKIEEVAEKQLVAEMHLATVVTQMVGVVNSAITQRRGFDKQIRDHERRLTAIEKRPYKPKP